MKSFFLSKILFALPVTIFFIYSFVGIDRKSDNNYVVGDVKYSILEPSKFMEANPGWVLMDGGTSRTTDSIYKKSVLWTKHQIPLPDARGVFIRGMNEKRDTKSGDVEGDRDIGAFQRDTFTKHTHHILVKHHAAVNFSDGIDPPRVADHEGGSQLINGRESNVAGSDETRPRNIALYVYIKIN